VSGIFKDWVATTNLTDDDGNAALPKSFHEDYPHRHTADITVTSLGDRSHAD
jgi:hypothetical protein